ncbi:excalibur calcium-binding domain-containing protein [Corynebacterium breve]|uniref:Excalibur calcium-binding domain-containing protein n=1 Tax=Corynebacterium breve TaxID=3049799 RepID=A0ABY8VH18_9CORY|nr:excalibur calcium-binding domain-containing protein [Corynebacterium breve]WIM68803.1 excalibur calcium-binding domain-containing protein [Corynebacterium breve]
MSFDPNFTAGFPSATQPKKKRIPGTAFKLTMGVGTLLVLLTACGTDGDQTASQPPTATVTATITKISTSATTKATTIISTVTTEIEPTSVQSEEPAPDPTPTSEQAPAPEPAAAENNQQLGFFAPPAPAPAPEPAPAPAPQSTYYANCAAARAAGVAPLYTGSPGYRSGLDRDGDGIACE